MTMNKDANQDSDSYTTTLALLREALSKGVSIPEISDIWNAKDRVLARYSTVFSSENIPFLSPEEYQEFLRFENNCHWSSLSRSAKSAGNDIAALRNVLQQLLDESVPIADRINATFGKLPGLSRAVLTPILLIAYPEKYGVWNTPAESALKQVGLWPAGSGLSQGEIYEKINATLHRLAQDLQIDLWTLDSLWWFIMRQQEAAEQTAAPNSVADSNDEDLGANDDEDEDAENISPVDRQDVDTARKLIEKWVPNEAHRIAILKAFADAITAANDINPNSWGVTLKQTRLRLNVGPLEALVIRKRPHRDGYFYVLLEYNALTDTDLLYFETVGCIRGDQVYKSQPGTLGLFIPHDRVNEVIERIKETAFLPRVRAAAKARIVAIAAKSHSSNVIEYIEEALARRLPEPGYSTEASLRSDARIWKIAAGERGSIWDIWKREGYCSIGWDMLGSLNGITKEEYYNRRSQATILGDSRDLQAWRFANELKIGDRIIANKGISQVLGIGTIIGPYYFIPDTDMGNRYPVRWDEVDSFEIEPAGHWRSTLISVSKEQYKAILAQCPQVGNDDNSDIAVASNAPYSIDDALSDLFMEEQLFRDIIILLQVKKNVILQGAPGVGKTFVARRIAYALMEEKDESRLEFVQFHQSYSYEDFIQGFRPQEGGGFSLKDGVFHRFCKRAERDLDRPYVFIIDEINRGNLSKIFGELLMLIESDKRGPSHSMPLLYSDSRNVRFHVPANVHILGMMNTADRSLAMVDYALRRRFAFVTLPPGFESPKFREFLISRGADPNLVGHVIMQMASLNRKIAEDIANLGNGFCIGHSFFTPGRKVTPDGEWLARIIQHEIEPLLREYYIDKENEIDAILSNLRGSYC